MKTQINLSALLLLMISTILFSNCKKESPKPAPSAPGNTCLATSNHSESYLPLALNNVWSFQDAYGHNSAYRVVDTNQVGSLLYYKFNNGMSMRTDADTNIYIKYSDNEGDELLIPGQPTVNLSYGSSTHSRTILSTDFTLEIESCIYTNCLMIQEIDNGGTPYIILFKRNFGFISGSLSYNYWGIRVIDIALY